MELSFKEAGVLLARLHVDRRLTCGIKPSRTAMAKPVKWVEAESAAATI